MPKTFPLPLPLAQAGRQSNARAGGRLAGRASAATSSSSKGSRLCRSIVELHLGGADGRRRPWVWGKQVAARNRLAHKHRTGRSRTRRAVGRAFPLRMETSGACFSKRNLCAKNGHAEVPLPLRMGWPWILLPCSVLCVCVGGGRGSMRFMTPDKTEAPEPVYPAGPVNQVR